MLRETNIFGRAVALSDELWRLIIPGAWAISRSLFLKLGGYDERLLYGENTELFFRIRTESPKQAMIDKINFVYHPSKDGGSKNTRNKIDSLIIILDKHQEFFAKNNNVRRLYTQVVGVSYLRLNQIKEGRDYLLRAYLLNPLKPKALFRLIVSCLPLLARRIYLQKE